MLSKGGCARARQFCFTQRKHILPVEVFDQPPQALDLRTFRTLSAPAMRATLSVKETRDSEGLARES